MALNESARLAVELKQENVPVRHIVVNQIVDEGKGEKFLNMKRSDQNRALQIIRDDPALSQLQLIVAPMVDLEVRGVAGLRYFGSQVWKKDG